jgi:hypothetical protein
MVAPEPGSERLAMIIHPFLYVGSPCRYAVDLWRRIAEEVRDCHVIPGAPSGAAFGYVAVLRDRGLRGVDTPATSFDIAMSAESSAEYG